MALLAVGDVAGSPFPLRRGWCPANPGGEGREQTTEDEVVLIEHAGLAGDGVKQDHKQAYRFFFQAANQGDRKAGKNLDAVARQLTEADLESLRAEMGEANFESEEN